MQRWTAIFLLVFVGGFSGAVVAAIPDIEVLIKNYPVGSDSEVKSAIGGQVNTGVVVNTNAIRMSRAFNLSGVPIPAGPSASVAGLHTFKGGDKRNYAYRVNELKTWMIKKYGQPILQFKAGPYGKAPQALAGRKGIIVFDDFGRSDAVAHFDLWDGQRVVGKDMFALAKQVYLWDSRPLAAAHAKQGKMSVNTSVRNGPSGTAAIVGSVAAGTVVTLQGGPVSNFYDIGGGKYVPVANVILQ